MNIGDYRKSIDEIDAQIVKLYNDRIAITDKVGEYKKENNLPVLDSARERRLLEKVASMAGEDTEKSVRALYSVMLDISRSRQTKIMSGPTELSVKMDEAVNNTQKMFPEKATVACQGTEGAYSQIAAEKLIKHPSIMFVSSFEGVFSAVKSGLCKYGVLPLENSTAGTVNQIYDLMIKYNFSIVRTVRVQISHVLAAAHGAKLSDIKEIYSHEQAIAQCSKFLGSLNGVKVVPCENTAIAAKMVAESGRKDVAAICSKECVEAMGLSIVRDGICDESGNYTRFACISKNLEIYPGADKTSVMMILPHKAGSLYKVLSKLYVLGINLIKLESRAIPNRNFEFMFYFDFDESIYSPALKELLCQLEGEAQEFKYLGSYSEVV